MKIGTKSILFGVHQFAIHPLFVALAWWKLYGFPFDPRLWFAFFLHDIGYFGKPNMDGPEGETHVEVGAKVMGWIFGDRWFWFTLLHSRFYAKAHGRHFSRLCVADKLALSLTPDWLYLLQANLTGEIEEYMKGDGARSPAEGRSQREWLLFVKNYCREWAFTHRDGREDLWTNSPHRPQAADPNR
jgi:hypothetical protein